MYYWLTTKSLLWKIHFLPLFSVMYEECPDNLYMNITMLRQETSEILQPWPRQLAVVWPPWRSQQRNTVWPSPSRHFHRHPWGNFLALPLKPLEKLLNDGLPCTSKNFPWVHAAHTKCEVKGIRSYKVSKSQWDGFCGQYLLFWTILMVSFGNG